MSSARIQSVRDICLLTPDERTEEMISEILEFVKDVKVFTRLSVWQQRALCRTMLVEEFGPRENVFSIGDRGDKFYIILSGSVGVQAANAAAPCPNGIHADKCDCPNRHLETVLYLEDGMGFGELALQSEMPRSATIVTSEKTLLLVTQRKNYERFAGHMHRQFIEERVCFLRNLPRIEDALQRSMVSTHDVAAMANCLAESSLSGCGIVVRQGDPVDQMIFVRSGQLAMVKVVDAEAAREAQANRRRLQRLKVGTTGKASSSTYGYDDADKHRGKRKRQKGLAPDSMMEQRGDSKHGTSQVEFTCNLAKAMMNLRKEAREKKLDDFQLNLQRRMPGLTKIEEHATVKDMAVASAAKPKTVSPILPIVKKADAPKKSADNAESTQEKKTATGATLWGKLRAGVKQASIIKRVVTEGDLEDDLKRLSLKHAEELAHARAQIGKAKARITSTPQQSQKLNLKEGQDANESGGLSEKTAINGKRKCLLRIGTVSPYQYFGDQQVGYTDAVYPVSLITDPVAEYYTMTKHDILRRLPKRIFQALFGNLQDSVPTDAQLMEMFNQTKRWDSFRKGMHGEAASSGRRVGLNSAEKLDFLGISTMQDVARPLPALQRVRGAALTPKDEEHFSQSSARFLRHFDHIRRDPGLRSALRKAGLDRRRNLSDSLSDFDDETQNPMSFHFELHWSKLRKPSLLDIEVDACAEEAASAAASAQTPIGTSSVVAAGVRVADAERERPMSSSASTPGGGRRTSVASGFGTSRRQSITAKNAGASDGAGGGSSSGVRPADPRTGPYDVTISMSPINEFNADGDDVGSTTSASAMASQTPRKSAALPVIRTPAGAEQLPPLTPGSAISATPVATPLNSVRTPRKTVLFSNT